MKQIRKTSEIVESMLGQLSAVVDPILPNDLKSEIVTMLNDRLVDEYIAHYYYFNAGNWCNNQGYVNAGKFFIDESNSELEHVKKLQDYLIAWNVQPEIPQVETKTEINGLVEIINRAYQLEYNLLLKYSENLKQCLVKDSNTFLFLQDYVKIQNESVIEYSDLLNTLRLIDWNDKYQLLYFENEYFGD